MLQVSRELKGLLCFEHILLDIAHGTSLEITRVPEEYAAAHLVQKIVLTGTGLTD